MRKHLYYIGLLVAVVALTTVATACGDDADSGRTIVDARPQKGNVCLRLSLTLRSGGGPSGQLTRAGEADNKTPGTTAENRINTIDLLFYNADDEKLTDIIQLKREQLNTNIKFEINDIKEDKFVYAVVNMPDAFREKLITGTKTDLSFKSSDRDYWDAINDFVPETDGQADNLDAAKGIFMTGSALDGNNARINIADKNPTEDNPLKLNADVARGVAKMHLLATVEENVEGGESGIDYVHTEVDVTGTDGKALPGMDKLGWVRLDAVRYLPNATNRSSYLFPQKNDAADGVRIYDWKDLNMDFADYAVKDAQGTWNFRTENCKRDFIFYTGLEQHIENIADKTHFGTAEEFDRQRLDLTLSNSSSASRYTKGMYCPENYFDKPGFDSYDGAIPVVTHMAIAARMVPKWLVVSKSYLEKMNMMVKAYKGKSLYAEYGLGEDDFGDDDVARWETEIRPEYEKYLDGSENTTWADFIIIPMQTEADALDFINWSLKFSKMWSRSMTDFQSGKYPDGTFYSYDRRYSQGTTASNKWQDYLYLTMDAVVEASKTDNNFKAYAVQHVGGWGYYYTYLEQLKSTQSGKTPFTDSQVTRNTYYLVNIEKITSPGGTVTRPEYIKVNTMSVGWNYEGRGDIDLH